MMDPKLLANYHARQRPPVFLAARPATSVKRRDWVTIAYAALAVFAVATCAAVIIYGL